MRRVHHRQFDRFPCLESPHRLHHSDRMTEQMYAPSLFRPNGGKPDQLMHRLAFFALVLVAREYEL